MSERCECNVNCMLAFISRLEKGVCNFSCDSYKTTGDYWKDERLLEGTIIY